MVEITFALVIFQTRMVNLQILHMICQNVTLKLMMNWFQIGICN